MGITARWYDEARRIWYEEVSDIWTVDEYWESVEATHRALDAVAPQPVYLITLARGPVRIPPGFITALRNVSIQARPHERLHVFVGGGTLVRSLYRIRNIFNIQKPIHLVNTLEEALALIEQDIAQGQTQK